MREALRDWKMKRTLRLKEMEALKADIDKGLTDLAEGRVQDFDAERIIQRGRKLLAARYAVGDDAQAETAALTTAAHEFRLRQIVSAAIVHHEEAVIERAPVVAISADNFEGGAVPDEVIDRFRSIVHFSF